jgi:hypothetical protein
MLAFPPPVVRQALSPGHSTSAGLANRDFLDAALILTTDRATADMGGQGRDRALASLQTSDNRAFLMVPELE